MTKKTSLKKLAKNTKFRFVVVGGTNTVIDFGILNVLVLSGLPSIVANTISTGTAMTFSFFMNKKWTFTSKSKDYAREVVLFLLFTLFGLWIIQNGVLWLTLKFVPNFGLPKWIFLNCAKIVASVPSLIWNYLTYSRFVFKKKS
ncbi:MAG: GtrA family protein [Candidatus Nomurabacteria bacterium]|jgi:putative flippase GtrA|nr:GtrA family protein [Candidatus Nomurabacteria bacterium]